MYGEGLQLEFAFYEKIRYVDAAKWTQINHTEDYLVYLYRPG